MWFARKTGLIRFTIFRVKHLTLFFPKFKRHNSAQKCSCSAGDLVRANHGFAYLYQYDHLDQSGPNWFWWWFFFLHSLYSIYTWSAWTTCRHQPVGGGVRERGSSFFPLICKLQKYVPRAGKTVLFACRSTQTRTQSTSSSVIARGSIPSLISLGKHLDGWNRFYWG